MERIRLEKQLTAGLVPDIAVFIDGLNDISLYLLPDQSGQSSSLQALVSHNKLLIALRASNTMTLLTKIVKRILDQPAKPPPSDAQVLAALDRLQTNRRILEAICKRFGIVPVFVHQPAPYYRFDNSKRAIPLSDSMENRIRGMASNINLAYTELVRRREQGLLRVDHMLWLEDFSIEENQYVDYVHYSPDFNRAIGREIGKHIYSPPMELPVR